ncbi:ribosomal-protein-alanine N-acetyltransferase [Pseudooceanicola antarcticus]|uniref:GNAT family N-acetyltransferase n=1 Tax=Pseudooceanicola antarcticus TaxID=1247613 RepID=A0A285IGI8_9RHOB|nr:GNAT family N-acetyltransferase [Pseudooceanicola antarcticus]PJE29031.1 GNAT family N-acetyltransferase [Pseudooceanicola antarcticus]SNY47120.1 ribosomal-protein-alanine N-acetyltransferase [Pseudooceanicola antarcticus]
MSTEASSRAQALAALHAACFTTPRPWSAAEIAQLIGDRHCFLLETPGGFLLARQLLDEAEILTLAVDPAARRRGLGRALVESFLSEASARGTRRALLEVAADNGPAIALYLSAGFEKTGRRPGYYRTPDGAVKDAEIMSKDLG